MKRLLFAAAGLILGAVAAQAAVPEPANILQYTAVNPAAQTSTTGIMAGIGQSGSFTPHFDGVALVTITGTALPGAAATATIQLTYGTGTPPANNATPVGSACGAPAVYTMGATTGYAVPFTVTCAVTGLTLNVGYWFDLNAKTSASTTLTLTNIGVTAAEE